MQLFDRPGDYQDFLEYTGSAQARIPVRCLAYCLMPNHFHFVLWPRLDGDLSAFMFRLTTKHSTRWHVAHGTRGTGPVYQGRFKSLPVSADGHFLRLCRYVERNPVRAGLVDAAEEWPWSSLAQRLGRESPVRLDGWPVPRPEGWLELLKGEDQPETDEVRSAVRRGRPYGPEIWGDLLARRLGIRGSLRPMGRPRKSKPGFISYAP